MHFKDLRYIEGLKDKVVNTLEGHARDNSYISDKN